MADVSSNLYSWSTTASSNSPAGATNVGSGLDDNLRQLQATVREGLAHYNSTPVASAGTVDLGAQTGNFLIISGTTTITAFGTVSAGIWKVIRFSGALTLTHNATTLILPGAANITTVAGDQAMFTSEGSGNWRCNWYARNAVPIGDINALTAETTIATGDTFPVYDASATAHRKFTVQTVMNAVNVMTEDTSPDKSNDYVLTWDASASAAKKVKPDNLRFAGEVVQVVNTLTTAYDSTTTLLPIDDSVPQSGEGKEFMTRAITPTHASNKLRIDVLAVLSHTVDTATIGLALFQDATANALSAVASTVAAAGGLTTMQMTYYMAAGTTSETTFKVRGGSGTAGTTGFNGAGGGRLFAGVAGSSITITEIKV
jgi:hypothetical protein